MKGIEPYAVFVDDDAILSRLFSRYCINVQLQAIRKQSRLTQAQLAAMCELSPGTISRIENGKEVNLNTIIKYASALGYELSIRKIDNEST